MPDPRRTDGRPEDHPDEHTPPTRRPSGAPEIPEILREHPGDELSQAEQRRRKREERRKSPEWRAAGVGLEFASMVAGGCVMGYIFDRWQGTHPYGLAIGGAVGLVSGGIGVIRSGMRLNRDMDAWENEQRRNPTDDT